MTSLDSGIVTVVNSHTLKTVKRIRVMPEAYGASIDPRRHRYYIGHADSRAASGTEPLKPFNTVLEVLDTRTNKLLRPVYAGGFTRNQAVDPTTGRVYVNNLATGTMTILGPNLKVRQTVRVGLGPRGIAFNPDTRKLYVGNSAVSQGEVSRRARAGCEAGHDLGDSRPRQAPQGAETRLLGMLTPREMR